jgi:hypothetical protein
MKTRNILSVALIALTFLAQSCEKGTRIYGEGRITTETLSVSEFTGIQVTGVSDVHISFGPVQKVEATGHPNIIALVQQEVRNGTWNIELEDGNYGQYDLEFDITIPYIDLIRNIGTGDVVVEDEFNVDQVDISLEGTGGFEGFLLEAKYATVDIMGTGNCEISASESLDAVLEGTGSLYYKGNPAINADVSGTGKVVNAN